MGSKARWKRLLAYMLAFAMVFSSVAVSSFGTVTVQAASKSVKKVTLKIDSKDITKKTRNLYVGGKKRISVEVSPENSRKKVTYQSTKPSVATVGKKGLIKAKKKGTTQINVTVTGKDNKKTKTYLKVTVKNVSLSLDKKDASLEVGKTTTLKATSKPDRTVKWSSSDTSVATVTSKGVVKGVKAGTATITAQAENTKATCKVTVKAAAANVAVTSVEATILSSNIAVGGATQITANVLPANATDKTLAYSSDNESVATVTETGTVIGMGEGTANITVRSSNGKTATVQVSVKRVQVTGITVSPNSTELGVTEIKTLVANILPEDASAQLVKWSSDNKAVATVDEDTGKVTGIAVGTATITAKATDDSGVIGQCVVTVVDRSGVTIELRNPYTENGVVVSDNTILYGNDMDVRVRVMQNDQPLPNANVTLKMDDKTPGGSGRVETRYEIKRDYATTDAQGYASFIIGLRQSQAGTSAIEGGTPEIYNLIASEVSSGKKAELIVNTATIDIKGIKVVQKELNASDNFEGGNKNWPVFTTKSLESKRDQQYVMSQKVSLAGQDANKVEFSASPQIRCGLKEKVERDVWAPEEAKGASSGSYSVYYDKIANNTTKTEIRQVPSGLKYITLNFEKISLSEYTKIVAGLYYVDAEGNYLEGGRKTKTITHKNNNQKVSIQIDAAEANVNTQNRECRLVVSVMTKGQVSSTEEGYILKSVEGVWETDDSSSFNNVDLPGSTVQWEIISGNNVGYESEEITDDNIKKDMGFDKIFGKEYKNYKYQSSIPVFPYSGDAFITVTHNNNSVGVYAYPTKNNNNNKNVLATSEDDNVPYQPILVTNQETKEATGVNYSISGNNVIVNSETTGWTHLKATININGLDSDQFNLLNGKELYTSVQWAPVSTISSEAVKDNDYFAIEGQTVTVKAQLCDSNGNPKSASGEQIIFTQDTGKNIDAIDIGQKVDYDGNVTLVSNIARTDSNGEVQLTLLGATEGAIENLKASCPGYYVKLSIITNGSVTNIDDGSDIYWVDLGLNFDPTAEDNDNFINSADDYSTVEWGTAPNGYTWYTNDVLSLEKADKKGYENGYAITRNIGEKWHIGYRPVASYRDWDKNGDHKIEYLEVANVPIDYTVSSNTVSINSTDPKNNSFTIKDRKDKNYLEINGNVATVTSQRNIKMFLTGTIDAQSIDASKVEFIYSIKDNSGNTVEKKRHNVGSGVSVLVQNTGLMHTINWKSTDMGIYLKAEKTLIGYGVSTNVVVQVRDSKNNVEHGKDLKYTIVGPGGPVSGNCMPTDKIGKTEVSVPAAYSDGVYIITVTDVNDSSMTASTMITVQALAGRAAEYGVSPTSENEASTFDEVITETPAVNEVITEEPVSNGLGNEVNEVVE